MSLKTTKCFFYRFSRIKLYLIADFFQHQKTPVSTIRVESLADALAKGLDVHSILFFWGKKQNKELLAWARANNVEVRFVEDGFIRSLGLGSALSKPLSITMDTRGVYFDPTEPSDLENILQNQDFSETQVQQAGRLIGLIVKTKVSKYNHQLDDISFAIEAAQNQKIILVPGQVDDDMSVKFGAPGMCNLKLLQAVREQNPDAYIVYKPHPDVLSKNRKGDLDDKVLLQYADRVVRHVGINTVLDHVHEVHTMTSLVGFESLVHGLKVVTYGMPFYAGWGLTVDMVQCERRTRQLTLPQLVAGTLIQYPVYLHPKSKEFVDVFTVLAFIAHEKAALQTNCFKRLRLQILGWILPRCRNFIKAVTGKSR